MKTRRGAAEYADEESYYISMTDMMVGVIFIFIILLSFFALQFRSTTAALTRAKDAQTQTLLGLATHLERQDATLEIDREHRVVCIPGSALSDSGKPGDADRHCFAYSDSALSQAQRLAQAGVKARAAFMTFLQADLARLQPPVPGAAGEGDLTFAADKLFLPNSATLSPQGEATARAVATALAGRLPCFGYGAPAPSDCAGAGRMSVVNVAGQAGFDAFTAEGRAAVALSLSRSVAFHDALVRGAPVLARITDAPPGTPGAQPLLRVSTYGQSQAGAPAPGTGQTISLQFQMAG